MKSNGANPHIATAEVCLADRLRQFRLDKGLTLQALGDAAGISQAFLSRVENHRTSLTVANLERLASVLGVPIAAFFEEDNRTVPITLCRAGSGPRGRMRGADGFLYELLSSAKKGKLMEPLIVDIHTAGRTMELRSHPGEEFNYVLSGECELIYGKETHRLGTGDAVYYDATVPHAARARRGKECRVLCIVASRDYLFHGDLSRLMNGETQ
jgi:transcriptional regulator with XRE-family HTH domain